ncbi:MAG: QueT transporter family protein [Tissierellia bacterium]|nr:QueT transporter family protein [Tissierellia bacterium]
MKTRQIVQAGLIAALYVVLTMVSNALGLSSGVIQLRLSESLTILPYFTPAAIPGVFIGCLLANLLTGAIWADVIFGSLASLLAAYLSYRLRHRALWLATLPPIFVNALVVPLILRYAYGIPGNLLFFILTVGLGQIASAGLLGVFLGYSLKKRPNIFD